MTEPGPRRKFRLGFYVFGVLTGIKIVEYAVGVSMESGSWPLLLVLALVGAGAILFYFMHIRHLWGEKEQ